MQTKSKLGRTLRRHSAPLALLAAGLTSACGDDGSDGTSLSGGPLYAIMYEMYDDNGDSISYLNLLNSLDVFTYTGEGQGLAAVFDESQVSFDETTDPWDYAGSPVWSIWNVDLASRTGAPIPGIPLSAGAYTPAVLDGRTFLMVPNAGWSSSDLYEVKADGAVPSLEVPGWSYMFVKVR